MSEMNFENCVCGNKSYDIFRDFGKHKVLICSQCGLLRSYPLPDESICSTEYQMINDVQKLHPHQVFVLGKVIKSAKNFDSKILDVGCSTGNMMKYLVSKGFYNVNGIEADEYAVKICEEKKLNVNKMNSIDLQLEDKFDVIYLNHVLEHIPDLNGFLNQAKSHLNKKGKVIIAVPNIGGKNTNNENWIGYQFNQHFWHFTPSSLKNLFEKNGFDECESNTLSGGIIKSALLKILKIQGDSLVSVFEYV